MEMFADTEQLGIYLAAILVTLLAVLLPMSAYAAQKWAHKTYLEVRSINAKLTELLEAGRGAPLSREPDAPDEPRPNRRREPTLGDNPGRAAAGVQRPLTEATRPAARGDRAGGQFPQ